MKKKTFSPSPILYQRWLGLLMALAACLVLPACQISNPPAAMQAPSPTVATPRVTPTTQPFSVQVTPADSATPTPACAPAMIVQGVIDTRLLDKPMRYNVYLPPCYSDNPEKRYPVLYLLHGQGFSEDQWLRIGAASAATRLISSGQLPPFLIIMPYDYSYQQPTDYQFEEVMVGLLLPQIDMAYRTIPDRDHRAIGGLSRGGAWAIHIGIRHPDLFSAIGAHSPAIFYTDTSTMRLRLRDLLKGPVPVFYVDAGDSDVEFENVDRFASLLDEMNLPHEWHYNIGFHNEKYWSAHVEEYLRWYASGWEQ